ncbi:unnamed protein product [Periconia digitata]|uniref:Uncharacterized protein n=1 Tax=Periconia digitata TaxID=1303443 RepID=A0A9W4U984_9PLEO|nr:unnamed protein product [Periconia digitata]
MPVCLPAYLCHRHPIVGAPVSASGSPPFVESFSMPKGTQELKADEGKVLHGGGGDLRLHYLLTFFFFFPSQGF